MVVLGPPLLLASLAAVTTAATWVSAASSPYTLTSKSLQPRPATELPNRASTLRVQDRRTSITSQPPSLESKPRSSVFESSKVQKESSNKEKNNIIKHKSYMCNLTVNNALCTNETTTRTNLPKPKHFGEETNPETEKINVMPDLRVKAKPEERGGPGSPRPTKATPPSGSFPARYNWLASGPPRPAQVQRQVETTPLTILRPWPEANVLQSNNIVLIEWRWAELGIYFAFASFVVATSIARAAFHRSHFLLTHVPESCLMIIMGAAVGGVLFGFGVETQADSQMATVTPSGAEPTSSTPKPTLASAQAVGLPALTPRLFFNVLIPPVILECAYHLYDKSFLETIYPIFLHAVLGKFINTLSIAAALLLVDRNGLLGSLQKHGAPVTANYTLGVPDALFYASVASGVDAAGVLPILEESGVHKNLFFIILGESLLNDAITVTLGEFAGKLAAQRQFDRIEYLKAFFYLSIITVGGFILGIIGGLVSALVTRATQHCAGMEPLALLGLAYVTYIVTEMIQFSGHISIISCGLVQAHYAFKNISHASYHAVKDLAKMIGNTSEAIIHLFLGMVLVSNRHSWHAGFVSWTLLICVIVRLVVTVLLSTLQDLMGGTEMPLGDQVILAYSGIRGAVVFCLIHMSDPNLVAPRQLFITSILALIIFTNFFQGLSVRYVMELLELEFSHSGHHHKSIEQEVHDQILDAIKCGMEEICGATRSSTPIADKFQEWDEKYFKKLFVNVDKHEEQSRLFNVYSHAQNMTLLQQQLYLAIEGAKHDKKYSKLLNAMPVIFSNLVRKVGPTTVPIIMLGDLDKSSPIANSATSKTLPTVINKPRILTPPVHVEDDQLSITEVEDLPPPGPLYRRTSIEVHAKDVKTLPRKEPDLPVQPPELPKKSSDPNLVPPPPRKLSSPMDNFKRQQVIHNQRLESHLSEEDEEEDDEEEEEEEEERVSFVGRLKQGLLKLTRRFYNTDKLFTHTNKKTPRVEQLEENPIEYDEQLARSFQLPTTFTGQVPPMPSDVPPPILPQPPPPPTAPSQKPPSLQPPVVDNHLVNTHQPPDSSLEISTSQFKDLTASDSHPSASASSNLKDASKYDSPQWPTIVPTTIQYSDETLKAASTNDSQPAEALKKAVTQQEKAKKNLEIEEPPQKVLQKPSPVVIVVTPSSDSVQNAANAGFLPVTNQRLKTPPPSKEVDDLHRTPRVSLFRPPRVAAANVEDVEAKNPRVSNSPHEKRRLKHETDSRRHNLDHDESTEHHVDGRESAESLEIMSAGALRRAMQDTPYRRLRFRGRHSELQADYERLMQAILARHLRMIDDELQLVADLLFRCRDVINILQIAFACNNGSDDKNFTWKTSDSESAQDLPVELMNLAVTTREQWQQTMMHVGDQIPSVRVTQETSTLSARHHRPPPPPPDLMNNLLNGQQELGARRRARLPPALPASAFGDRHRRPPQLPQHSSDEVPQALPRRSKPPK